jgi:hypothetical protein
MATRASTPKPRASTRTPASATTTRRSKPAGTRLPTVAPPAMAAPADARSTAETCLGWALSPVYLTLAAAFVPVSWLLNARKSR